MRRAFERIFQMTHSWLVRHHTWSLDYGNNCRILVAPYNMASIGVELIILKLDVRLMIHEHEIIFIRFVILILFVI